MWDNRAKKASGEFKSNAPDFKCRCGHIIWGEKKEEVYEEPKLESPLTPIIQTPPPLAFAPKLPTKETDQLMWEKKERKNFKGKCYMYAMECMKLSKTPQETRDMTDADVDNLIQLRATNILNWIYNGT